MFACRHGRHLAALNVGDSALGMQDDEIDIGLAAQGGDRGRAGVARRCDEYERPFAAALQRFGHQRRHELQREVLERERRAVEEFEQIAVGIQARRAARHRLSSKRA